MYTIEERDAIRDRLVEHARHDALVTGCALLGSAARDEEDAWSDVDLALTLTDGTAAEEAATRWSAWLAETFEVADSLDVRAAGALYRVFLLTSSLQVDLSFWPHGTFRAVGGPVRPVFGEVGAPEPSGERDPVDVVRAGWLHALHARSAVARGRSWQAEMMLAELRNRVLALACLRHGLDPAHGRQAHRLPEDVLEELAASRASGLDPAEQRRSLRATVDIFRSEVARHDHELAASLTPPLDVLGADPSPNRFVDPGSQSLSGGQ